MIDSVSVDSSNEQAGYWLGFNRVPGIGVVRIRRLLEAFGDIQRAWEATPIELAAAGLGQREITSLVTVRKRFDRTVELGDLQQRGIKVVTIDQQTYPRRLREIYAAPPVLFVLGQLLPEDDLSVAVVGTRHATAYGRAVTEKISFELAKAGVTVISGMARGHDSFAHRSALQAGGRTLAVYACGLDIVYPPENRELAGEIAKNGAVISEHPLGTRPEAQHFPARNRIVSGLARATLIVEAGERSGALITAQFANDQGRDVMAVPGPINSPRSVGTNRLIQDGAKLVQSVEDIFSELGMVHRQSHAVQSVFPDLLAGTPNEAAIMAKLSDDPMSPDDLSRELKMSAQEVGTSLTMLEIQGRVRQLGGLVYIAQRAF